VRIQKSTIPGHYNEGTLHSFLRTNNSSEQVLVNQQTVMRETKEMGGLMLTGKLWNERLWRSEKAKLLQKISLRA
jgi:hypothetical protein